MRQEQSSSLPQHALGNGAFWLSPRGGIYRVVSITPMNTSVLLQAGLSGRTKTHVETLQRFKQKWTFIAPSGSQEQDVQQAVSLIKASRKDIIPIHDGLPDNQGASNAKY